jgi:hypothetical protein
MPHSVATAGSSLADRYGRPTPGVRRRSVIVAASVVVLATLGWAVWVGVRQARTPVRWTDGVFTVVDDGHAQLRFQVTTTPGHQVICTVGMFNRGLTQVGRDDVHAGPSTSGTFEVLATVPTFELAASGQVRDCAVG